ncbi:hypothetical protein F2Q68_00038245 [Brassica cretica]|uniref:Uncharacterized protein n=1 Tax=Brassica cretica TaxID=69181 RepID=A0A8S9MK15_BRACR|nr:hypothetical protein F2Q68_00038245 [Brassica cretica]
MTMVVIVSFPSSLHPLLLPLRFRPPPDLPPRLPSPMSFVALSLPLWSSFLVPSEALSPPEPPDLPPCSPSPVPFRALFPPEPPDPPDASCRLIVLLHLDTPFTLVRLYSSISVGSHVDWYEIIAVWVSPNIWIMVLNCNVPVTFVSFGSDVVPARGFSVAFVRFPAFERTLTIWLLQLNMSMEGFHYPVASFVRLFFFPIFSPLWSELDAQASLVWLMLFSAYVAVFVTSQVTRYAFIQEGYGIVVRFLMLFCNEVYRHSIICLINGSVCLALSSFDVSSLGGVKLC